MLGAECPQHMLRVVFVLRGHLGGCLDNRGVRCQATQPWQQFMGKPVLNVRRGCLGSQYLLRILALDLLE
ncbi:hypothetical protein D3C84_1141290 [compost metagenome]